MISDARRATTLAHWVARPGRTAKGVAGTIRIQSTPDSGIYRRAAQIFLSSMKLKLVLLLILCVLVVSGCSHCELFSCIDRRCFIADWTNHHSCLSCCRYGSWDWVDNNQCPHCR